MREVIMFICLFLLVYIFYLAFVIKNKKSLSKMLNGKEMLLLKKMYNLDYNKLDVKSVAKTISLANSFILSFVTTLVFIINDYIDKFYIQLLVSLLMAFVILIPLILLIYRFIGMHYKKVQIGGFKNVRSQKNRK